MDISYNTPTRCAGGGHVVLTGTIQGQPFEVQTTLEELQIEPSERRQAIIFGARGLALDAGATNWTQARNAIGGQTRKV